MPTECLPSNCLCVPIYTDWQRFCSCCWWECRKLPGEIRNFLPSIKSGKNPPLTDFDRHSPDKLPAKMDSSHPLSTTTAQNTFEVEIQAKKLSTLNSSYSIPDFLSFGSVNNLPYLLVMSIETASGPVIDTGSVLSDNSSCLDAPFTYTVKNSTAQADEEASTSAQAATAASCGPIGPPSGPGPGQFLGLLVVGFFLSALPSRLSKRNKKILS